MATNAFPDDYMTQVEVAQKLGLSAARVSQLERSGLKKIRTAIESGEYPALLEDALNEEGGGRLSIAVSMARWSEYRRQVRQAKRPSRAKEMRAYRHRLKRGSE